MRSKSQRYRQAKRGKVKRGLQASWPTSKLITGTSEVRFHPEWLPRKITPTDPSLIATCIASAILHSNRVGLVMLYDFVNLPVIVHWVSRGQCAFTNHTRLGPLRPGISRSLSAFIFESVRLANSLSAEALKLSDLPSLLEVERSELWELPLILRRCTRLMEDSEV